MTAPLAAPPYALPGNEFPCPGLAALAARAPIGGQREAALACITLARLACAVGPPVELSIELRRERADAARAWLSTLPLESGARSTIVHAMSATATASRSDIAGELDAVAEKLSSFLDRAGAEDLARIAQRLRRQPAPILGNDGRS